MKLVLSFALALLGSAAAFGQAPPDPTPEELQAPADPRLQELKEKLTYLKLGAGFWGASVHRDGQELALGPFAGDAEAFFSEIPEAAELARRLRNERRLGVAIYLSGVALLLAEGTYLLYGLLSSNRAILNEGAPVMTGTLIGGFALCGVGGYLMQRSMGTLAETVNRFNAGLLNRLLPPGQQIDLQIFARRDGGGMALGMAF